MFDLENTKYHVQYTSRFKKEFKKVLKQSKDEEKFLRVLEVLANGEELDPKYKNCSECHIEPDWLLVYKYQDNDLVLLLFATGSHSDLFNK